MVISDIIPILQIKELRPRPFPIVTQPASDRAKARTQVLCPVLLPVTPAFPDMVFLVFFSTLVFLRGGEGRGWGGSDLGAPLDLVT